MLLDVDTAEISIGKTVGFVKGKERNFHWRKKLAKKGEPQLAHWRLQRRPIACCSICGSGAKSARDRKISLPWQVVDVSRCARLWYAM
jgi:hypothetical protein